MIKLTVLYGHPADPVAFERYYAETHMPLVARISGVLRHEKAKVAGSPGAEPTPYYRTFEAWFDDEASLGAAMGSPEGQAAVNDLGNFATGGVTVFVSAVE